MIQILKDITEITRCGAQYRTEQFAPIGLKSCHGSYLMEICNQPGISQEQLAHKICINKSNVARQVAVLEESGFVERRTCGKDKRIMRLYPTEKALSLLPEIERIMQTWQACLLQDLDEQEQLLLEKMLLRMRARACAWVEEINETDK